MRFLKPSTLLLSVTSLLVGSVTAEQCDNGPWTDVFSIGGKEGESFCRTKFEDGIVVTGIEVWASKSHVSAVQFYYSDGTDSGRLGKSKDDKEHERLDWDYSKGQKIDQMEMWGNGKGTALGRVHVKLNSGEEISVGKDTGGQDVFKHETHSGVLVGAVGAATPDDNKIDRLGFLFLKSEIDKVTVTDVVFEDTMEDLNAKNQ